MKHKYKSFCIYIVPSDIILIIKIAFLVGAPWFIITFIYIYYIILNWFAVWFCYNRTFIRILMISSVIWLIKLQKNSLLLAPVFFSVLWRLIYGALSYINHFGKPDNLFSFNFYLSAFFITFHLASLFCSLSWPMPIIPQIQVFLAVMEEHPDVFIPCL